MSTLHWLCRLKCAMQRVAWSSTRPTRTQYRPAETGWVLPATGWPCVQRLGVIDSHCRTDWTGCRWVWCEQKNTFAVVVCTVFWWYELIKYSVLAKLYILENVGKHENKSLCDLIFFFLRSICIRTWWFWAEPCWQKRVLKKMQFKPYCGFISSEFKMVHK